MDVLIDSIQQLSHCNDMASIQVCIKSAARIIAEADGVTFILKDGDRHYLDEDAINPLWKGRRFPASAVISDWAMQHKQPLLIEDVTQDPRVPKGIYDDTFVTSLAIIPICTGNPFGCIGLYWSKPHHPNADAIEQLQVLANCASLALGKASIYKQLNKRVIERTSELAKAKQEAEIANALKSKFLSATSHDLRQPLQQLNTLTAIIVRSIENSTLHSHALKMQSVIKNMEKLLNALLDLGKLESGAMDVDLHDLDLQVLLSTLKEDFIASAEEKDLQLTIEDTSLSVHTDPALLLQILRNVIGNAIKYTASGSINLQCKLLGSEVLVSVSDTGGGIAPEQQLEIFEPFHRLQPNSHDKQSYGLGLAIVKSLSELLNHPLAVESTLGKGSVFSIRIPVGKIDHGLLRDGSAQMLTTNKRRKATILYLEDDDEISQAMKVLLTLEDYNVVSAETVAEAETLLQNSKTIPDLVITDNHLACGENGLEAVKRLRKLTQRYIPSIMVTGYTEQSVHDEALTIVQKVFSKPVDADVLLGEINSLLTA